MTSNKGKIRLRFELEVVPIDIDSSDMTELIKDKFDALLTELIKDNLINAREGASMTMIDVTPIQWIL